MRRGGRNPRLDGEPLCSDNKRSEPRFFERVQRGLACKDRCPQISICDWLPRSIPSGVLTTIAVHMRGNALCMLARLIQQSLYGKAHMFSRFRSLHFLQLSLSARICLSCIGGFLRLAEIWVRVVSAPSGIPLHPVGKATAPAECLAQLPGTDASEQMF